MRVSGSVQHAMNLLLTSSPNQLGMTIADQSCLQSLSAAASAAAACSRAPWQPAAGASPVLLRTLYSVKMLFSAPSEMSSVGSAGRKSLPTSMHISTKSSTMRSMSNGKEQRTLANSSSQHSRSSLQAAGESRVGTQQGKGGGACSTVRA